MTSFSKNPLKAQHFEAGTMHWWQYSTPDRICWKNLRALGQRAKLRGVYPFRHGFCMYMSTICLSVVLHFMLPCPLLYHFEVFWSEALHLVLLEFELVHDVIKKLTTRHVLHHLSVTRPKPGFPCMTLGAEGQGQDHEDVTRCIQKLVKSNDVRMLQKPRPSSRV